MICRFILAALLALAGRADAAEGLWQPHELPAIEEALHAAGIAVDPRELAHAERYPMGAVVRFGGSCSAALISPLGLLVTNHHCASAHVPLAGELAETGFVAHTLGEELPAGPGLRVLVPLSNQDVTAQVLAKTSSRQGDREYTQAIGERIRRLVAACASGPGLRCEVHAFNGGAEYSLTRHIEIRDVRLAYAPAAALGAFGGSADYWKWPRHAADFALFRAYVGPDGKPADFSELNVPLRSSAHLELQPAGIAAGDFVMAIGYPGRTRRHHLAGELEKALEREYPASIERHQRSLTLLEEQARERPDAAGQSADQAAKLANKLAELRASRELLAASGALAARAAEEAAIVEWAGAHGHASGVAARAALLAELDERADPASGARNRSLWMATRLAYAKSRGETLYADGNGTLRVSFGKVRGEIREDGSLGPTFSDVAGLAARHAGMAPFDVGTRPLAAIEAKRFGPYAAGGSLPVNFLADFDVADGSSGSPVLNARAELVGIVFDGNHAAIANDWQFDPRHARAIAVDIRYLLWIMDAVDGAHRLLEEMGVEPAFDDAAR